MKETIKTGGVGKSPAIEKINRLNKITSRIQAAGEMERKAFQKEEGRAKDVWEKRKGIVEEFHISFKKEDRMGNREKILQGKGYESAVFPGYGRMRAGFCEHGFMDMGGWEMLHGAAGRISGDGGAQ